MKKRSAIKTDLFADLQHKQTLDKLGDPLTEIEACIDFVALAAEVDRIAPRPVSSQGGRPPFPTETMVRILVLKRLYNLSDEQMGGKLIRTIGQARANFAMTMMATCYNLKRLAYCQRMGIVPT